MQFKVSLSEASELLPLLGTDVDFMIGPVRKTMNLRHVSIDSSSEPGGLVSLEEVDPICTCECSCVGVNRYIIHRTGSVTDNVSRLTSSLTVSDHLEAVIYVGKVAAALLKSEIELMQIKLGKSGDFEIDGCYLYGFTIKVDESMNPAISIATSPGCTLCTRGIISNFALAK